MRRLRAIFTPARLLLVAIVVAGLALRVWNNDYALPFVFNLDEDTHFTSVAVKMFWHGLDPEYYENPSAYTYLIYLGLRTLYGPLGLLELDRDNVTLQFHFDPEDIWIFSRSLAAVLCMAGVVALYFVGSRALGRREGLVAAAILSFAFLPVAYSRLALTDVGALAGIALALLGALRVYERGRMWDYLLAGAGAGLAVGFKYTAGLALLPLLIAGLARVRREPRRVSTGLALAVGVAVALFVATNPYAVLSFDGFKDELTEQAEVAADLSKPGQGEGGFAYYLGSLGWGLGWAAIVAALAGAVLELRRDIVRGLILVALPISLFVYLAVQARYFGRWLLPAYPALALLAAVALVRASGLIRVRPAARAAALAGLTALVLAQAVAADIRTGMVHGRADTRELARTWLARHFPPELRIAMEPAIQGRYVRLNPDGRTFPPGARHCGPDNRDFSYVNARGRRVCIRGRKPQQFALPAGGVRASAYYLVLGPEVVDDFRFYGYCTVMTFSVVRDRALASGRPEVREYYDRLERESDWVKVFSPYDEGADPVEFDFDLSYNYYPTAYHRPGPEVRIHRLRDCEQGFGQPVVRVPKPRELPENLVEDF
jgi:hypothetical protein